MQFRQVFISVVFVITGLTFALPALAQQSQEYRIAVQLMNQQRYERAYEILSELAGKDPDNYLLYEKSIACLINLKNYEEAIQLSNKRINQGHSVWQTRIKLGSLYHLKGDTSQAFATWNKAIQRHADQLQAYLQVARAMKERNEFDQAIDVYQQAQKKFSNDQLFANELAFTYQMAGNYEKAIQQYLQLIKDNPRRIDFVKRSMMRFKDDYLYEVAAVEFDEYLTNLPAQHKAYRPLRQLYQWLLLEMKLYERALAEAKSFEAQTSKNNFALFQLGSRLLSIQKYELAEEAFRFYQNSSNPGIRQRSMEKLGDVYLQWADFQSDYNLVKTSKLDTLYNRAYHIYSELIQHHPEYQQRGRVLMKQAELALDHLNNMEKAASYLELMNNSPVSKARIDYIEGRIKLYNSNFDRARIFFTRANKAAESDDLNQKTRYFLALTDFYAGDFEYARIQLKALEKQSSSYFANDALQLRMWIQGGMQKDSATAELHDFADAVHSLEHGRMQKALSKLGSWLKNGSDNPLIDDAVLVLAKHSTTSMVPSIYTLLDRIINSGRNTPLLERLMWERARMAEQIVVDNLQGVFDASTNSDGLTREERFFLEPDQLTAPPQTRQEVQQIYEKLLIKYPQGFYSAFARERIQQLQNQQT